MPCRQLTELLSRQLSRQRHSAFTPWETEISKIEHDGSTSTTRPCSYSSRTGPLTPTITTPFSDSKQHDGIDRAVSVPRLAKPGRETDRPAEPPGPHCQSRPRATHFYPLGDWWHGGRWLAPAEAERSSWGRRAENQGSQGSMCALSRSASMSFSQKPAVEWRADHAAPRSLRMTPYLH